MRPSVWVAQGLLVHTYMGGNLYNMHAGQLHFEHFSVTYILTLIENSSYPF